MLLETGIDEPPSQELLLFLLLKISPFLLGAGITIVCLLVLSALVSGSEVAFFSLSAKDLSACRKHNKPTDRYILSLVKNPKKLLATVLILNNFINVAIVTLSTLVMWDLTGDLDEGSAITIATPFVITFFIVFFGEVIPKVYAIQNNLSFARMTAPGLKFFQLILSPVSFPLLKMSSLIEKRVAQKGFDISIEELNKALELTADKSSASEEELDILKGIVNFGTLTVTQVMKSRIDIMAVDSQINFHELMDKINKSGFSRIPVYTETIDKIDGILYVKDILPHIQENEHYKWQDLIRPGFFVPETKKIDTLLKDFQSKRVHMAIVVDEYGGTSGVITLDDVMEEIIGEINDEFDDEDIAYNKLDENTFVFEGKTLLNDFCKIIDESPATFEHVKGESESLGGLLLELHGKLPRAGEQITHDRFIFTVVAVDVKRIKRIRVVILKKTDDEKK
ncbi:MAG: gliding motility-associated protein GldE [Cyclobacteriaceae bacterium]|nr:gliding motility-associated protein GldE [Cyclobacteriaceae bacterium]